MWKWNRNWNEIKMIWAFVFTVYSRISNDLIFVVAVIVVIIETKNLLVSTNCNW